MPRQLASNPVTFHISLNVADIRRTVEFFRKVFGQGPTKHREDYAKFELENPPITLSLEPTSPAERGALNHVGFKFRSMEELVEFQRRLELSGVHSEREDGVECCYSKQTKFWLHDPDGTLWEMYVLEGDLEHRGAGQTAESMVGHGPSGDTALASPPRVEDEPVGNDRAWEHRLGMPLVLPDEIPTESLDEVALRGSFNGEMTESAMGTFLKQVGERLRPGGRLAIHCLTADRHVETLTQLPGPAAVVKSVPCLEGLLGHLEDAGFEAIRLTKYGSRACFSAGPAELRETMMEATKPTSPSVETVTVVYRGPLHSVTLDGGVIMRRGQRTLLPRDVVERFETSAMRDSFTIIESSASPASCAG